ncbi:LuxR C-terminal-related transcriptional regulator [Kutzneria albida]|uniref:LuxR C-terminal-related transcriptional regulator n=1 Tax=Kutzneria albida TaxID=43357 RepID=UPI0011DCC245|nr:hypothetical protein [Kutzneria albida]
MPGLTNRLSEIALLLGVGMSAREVARHLTLSAYTVRNHMKFIYLQLAIGKLEDLREHIKATFPQELKRVCDSLNSQYGKNVFPFRTQTEARSEWLAERQAGRSCAQIARDNGVSVGVVSLWTRRDGFPDRPTRPPVSERNRIDWIDRYTSGVTITRIVETDSCATEQRVRMVLRRAGITIARGRRRNQQRHTENG